MDAPSPRLFCRYCGGQLGSVAEQLTHDCVIYADNVTRCRICQKIVSNDDELKVHYMRDHSDHSICTICFELFDTKAQLNHHIQTSHQLQAQYICHICKKGFQRKDALDTHLLKHGDKASTCAHCRRQFTSEQELKKHLREQHQTAFK